MIAVGADKARAAGWLVQAELGGVRAAAHGEPLGEGAVRGLEVAPERTLEVLDLVPQLEHAPVERNLQLADMRFGTA